jgi:hypothetical protein
VFGDVGGEVFVGGFFRGSVVLFHDEANSVTGKAVSVQEIRG